MNPDHRILAARFDSLVWLRVAGKGSFQNSPDLKRYIEAARAEGENTFVVDLEDCATMDSTFMGTLTGIATSMSGNESNATLEVVNANHRNRQLLENLGLDQILQLDTDGSTHTEQREKLSGMLEQVDAAKLGKAAQAQHVLEAHETLAAAHEDNLPRFTDVIEFLKKDLSKHEAS